ncbi:MAG: MFS transporter, partial [Myxococcales bacterium]
MNVQQFIDSRPFGGFQLRVVALCALVVLIDGFDTQAIGYVAPAIIKSWHVRRADLGPVFAAGLTGLMIGALAFGPIADRAGRRPVLLFCTLFFGVLSLLTATAGSLQALLVYRFVTGLGLGGAMPNAIALTTEYAPKRVRATTIMIMFCGFSLGAALGGVAAAGLIARFGWKAVFLVGGAVPILAFPFLARGLPESIRFLVVRGGRNADVASILSRIDPAAAGGAGSTFTVEEHASKGFVVGQLFAERRAMFTLLTWVVFF